MLAERMVVGGCLKNWHKAIIEVVVPFSPTFEVDLAILVLYSSEYQSDAFDKGA